MLKEAISNSPYRDIPCEDENLLKTMEFFGSDPNARITVLLCLNEEPVGLIMGVVTPNIIHPAWPMATETVWYVKPEYRGRYSLWLLDAYEHWALKVGAKIIQLTNLGQERLDKLYAKRGFKKVEHSHIKIVE